MKIIAEVGSNFYCEQQLFDSVLIAKECGADAVKFQYFSHNDLYGFGSFEPTIDIEVISKLSKYAKDIGIEFMCTAFNTSGYMTMNAFVDTHKIASCEITDLDILDTVNSFGKPVYMSTGGASLEQIKAALKKLTYCQVTVFYCVGDYPAKIVDPLELMKLRDDLRSFDVAYGYSDHSIDVLCVPMAMNFAGASVIEKHVDFFDCKESPDHGHALNAVEFKLMCDSLKDKQYTLPPQSTTEHQRVWSPLYNRFVRPKK